MEVRGVSSGGSEHRPQPTSANSHEEPAGAADRQKSGFRCMAGQKIGTDFLQARVNFDMPPLYCNFE